ncbi:MAG: hypothetical protein M3Z92_12665 [Bacteroidota bacterium]|nr:hypothetical protein [Bacteroidota bacterium]MDQ6890780.1 hypothetical protein [Bacteroidota bacterium]
MTTQKELFLKNDFILILKKLNGDEKGEWGIMNAQQMVEHFTDAVKNASGKLILPKLNEGERLQKSRDFLMSEIPFKENTQNPLIPEKGIALRQPDIASAINKLQTELNYFFDVFAANPELKTGNAFFGDLDYAMNIQLLHKHAMHHLRQFGLV